MTLIMRVASALLKLPHKTEIEDKKPFPYSGREMAFCYRMNLFSEDSFYFGWPGETLTGAADIGDKRTEDTLGNAQG